MKQKLSLLILNLVAKYLLPKHQFERYDIIQSGMSDDKYRVEALYYNLRLEPILIVTDEKGRMASMEEKGLERSILDEGDYIV